jgi:PhnB protein
MQGIIAYLTFDGNAREAMTFYAEGLGAELEIMSFSDMPPSDEFKVPEEAKNRVMHARLSKGSTQLMASDTQPGMPFHQGNNFSISVGCESQQEIETLFAAIGKGGKVTMPLQDTFWGAHFGMLIDQFGIQWMFNFDKPKPA